jgi:hypothetical protein
VAVPAKIWKCAVCTRIASDSLAVRRLGLVAVSPPHALAPSKRARQAALRPINAPADAHRLREGNLIIAD